MLVLEQQILDHLKQLSSEQQEQVLTYIKTLRPKGTSGESLKQFIGSISPDELKQMEDVINSDLGQVNPDAW